MIRLAVPGLLLALVACGPKPLPAGGGGGGASEVLPDVPFDELDHDQRIQFMKQVVMPAMKPLFQAHDPGKFAKFGCKTCHGEAADRGEFHMPSDAIPKLDFADMSKFKPADIEWMKNEIKPTMARLLKQPEYSPENPRGFGCLECHMPAAGAGK